MIVGVRTGGSADPSLPLDVARVQKDGLRYAFVASKHQLSAPFGMDNDPESDFFGQPAMYEIQGAKAQRLRVHTGEFGGHRDQERAGDLRTR